MSLSEDTSLPVHLEASWRNFEKDPCSDQSVDFARTVAAYYLGLPLLIPRNMARLPSLYEWPKTSKEIDLDNFVVHKRIKVAKAMALWNERMPPILLWICNHRIEAIYYCDQFRDLKSQALLRFLEEQLTGLQLLKVFCESRIDAAFEELDSIADATDYGILQTMQISWSKLASSMLQMDAITQTQATNSLHDRILDKMCSIHATMPLFVDDYVPLPRPPVYMCSVTNGNNEEQYCFARLWILIQAYAHLLSDANVLLVCIEYFCWNFLKFNEQCEYFDRKFSNSSHYDRSRTKVIFWIRGFLKFILIILRLITRDTVTVGHRRGVKVAKWTTVKYHDLLDVRGSNGESDLLVRWMKKADSGDYEQLSHFFDYLRTFRSSYAHMGEFCSENIIRWRNHLLKEVLLQEKSDNNEMQQYLHVLRTHRTQVPDGVFMRAEYIARCWSYPTFAVDEQIYAVNLKLHPSDFVIGTNSNPSPQQLSKIEFAQRTCRYSVPDVRHHLQRPVTFTSRSFPTVTSHFKSNNALDARKMDSWRKLDKAMQKINVVINEVEQELENASCYVKALLNSQRMISAESTNNYSDGDERMRSEYNISSSKTSRTSRTSSIMGEYKFVNDDRYSLDSKREPEQHPEIERLNLDLLSPHPLVRNVAVADANNLHTQGDAPLLPNMQMSQRSVTGCAPLPMWLKLLPAKQKDFLLSLTPAVNQAKETRKTSNIPESQRLQIKLLEVRRDKKPTPPSNLKFELVTTIASKQLFEL